MKQVAVLNDEVKLPSGKVGPGAHDGQAPVLLATQLPHFLFTLHVYS